VLCLCAEGNEVGFLIPEAALPVSKEILCRPVSMGCFQACTAKMNLGEEVDLEDYVGRPDKINNAEIAAICQEAGMQAVRKNRCALAQVIWEVANGPAAGCLTATYPGNSLHKGSGMRVKWKL